MRVSNDLFERLVEIRRALHRRPELAFEEQWTARQIMAELDYVGVPYAYEGTGTAVIGSIAVDTDAPTVALRAEMDAWPGLETTDLPFASEVDGKMMRLPVSAATLRARYSSGMKITVSLSSDSTTATAFPEVQQTSTSALTSA